MLPHESLTLPAVSENTYYTFFQIKNMTSYVSFEMAYQNVLKSVQQKFSLVAYIVSCIRISEQDF